MISLRLPGGYMTRRLQYISISRHFNGLIVCGATGPLSRHPRGCKTRMTTETVSRPQKLIARLKEVSNVKEEVYGALDSFVAWDLDFPLVVLKEALRIMEQRKDWKRIIQVTKWMLSKGQGRNQECYYILLNALAEEGRLDEVEELWKKIFSKGFESLPRVFYIKMISIYSLMGAHEKMFEIFADMEELGVRPDRTIVEMMGKAFQDLGMLDKYNKLNKKYLLPRIPLPPPKGEHR